MKNVFSNADDAQLRLRSRTASFMGTEKGAVVATSQIVNLLNRIDRMNLEFIKLETLCTFDGEFGYSLGQGQ